MGADVDEVVEAMGLDPRIGPQFLRPGLGFGGFCLPKDVQAFIRLGEKAGVDVSLLKDAECINKKRLDSFLAKARQALWILKGKRIGILGLAFKPGTDDNTVCTNGIDSQAARRTGSDPGLRSPSNGKDESVISFDSLLRRPS